MDEMFCCLWLCIKLSFVGFFFFLKSGLVFWVEVFFVNCVFYKYEYFIKDLWVIILKVVV